MAGKRSRTEHRAERKEKRAQKKEKKADKKKAKGKDKAAERKKKKAEKKKTKAAKLHDKASRLPGLLAHLQQTSTGGLNLIVEWNYNDAALAAYEKLKLSFKPSSPLQGGAETRDVDIHTQDYTVPNVQNIGYRVRLLGVTAAGQENRIDEGTAKKLK
jgi:hypothetical protein